METISAREIDRYIFDKNYLLVDVRNPSEYRKQHIRGAVCVPREYLLQRVRGFGKIIPVLYCDRGGLSMQAARELEEHGYQGNFSGGRNTGLQWKVSGIRPEEKMRRECMIQGMNRLT